MQHWVEPAPLADAQRRGYNSPAVSQPGQGHNGVPALPRQAAPVARERVVNRPGQLSGFAEVLGGGVLSCLLCGGLGFWLGMTFQRARLRKKLEEL